MPDIRFDLPGPEYAEHKWVLFDEHAPSAQTPLLDDGPFGSMGPPSREEAVPRFIRINGFTYMRGDLDMTAPFASRAVVSTKEELRRWRTRWLPEVESVVAYLANFDAATVQPEEWAVTLEHQANEFRRVFLPIHLYAVGHAEVTARAFVTAYQQKFGGSETDGRALLQGFPNASLDRASMLWSISRTLRQDPTLIAAIEAGESLPEGKATRQLANVLDAYGHTTNSNNQDKPTWREDPSQVMTQALSYARQPDGQSPSELAAVQLLRREELEASLRAGTANDSAAEFLSLLEAAQEYLPNLEDHNYYVDQRLLAASRARYLAIGALLRSRRLTGADDDVFYLRQDELVGALEDGILPLQSEIERRREYVAACRQIPPPPILGKGAHQGRVTTIKGVGASKGSYQGRARMIDAIEDAALLQPGEVLVCRATTPAWTPLFGVAGAVVTNAGGALSHTAIVAREFGIPAVLGTQNGTQQIPDGAIVTVDGTAGLVTIHSDQ